MKIITTIITIFLIFGLLGIPNGAFAQDTSSTGSGSTLQCSNSIVLDNMVPLLKGGGGGRGGSSSSSKSSSSKKIKDGDDDDNSTDDDSSGFSWITVIIILVVLFGLIGFLVWFFLLRK